jgi:hypothetical protein
MLASVQDLFKPARGDQDLKTSEEVCSPAQLPIMIPYVVLL